MKLLTLFSLILFANPLFAQEPKCSLEIKSTDGKIFKHDLNISRLKRTGEPEKQAFWDLSMAQGVLDYTYSFHIDIFKNQFSLDFLESPGEQIQTSVKNGRKVILSSDGAQSDAKITENKSSSFSSKEESHAYKINSIKKENQNISFVLDNSATGNQINISCSDILFEGVIDFKSPKETKGNTAIPLDNSSSCSVKIQEMQNELLEILTKDDMTPNTHSRSVKQVIESDEYNYQFKVELFDDFYKVEAARHIGRKSVNNTGSFISIVLSNNKNNEISVEMNDSIFTTKNSTQTDQLYRKNKFIVSKVYKDEAQDILYIQLKKDSSKILLTCSSPLLEGQINYSSQEIIGKEHEDFLKSISSDQRSHEEKENLSKPNVLQGKKVIEAP